MKSFEIRLARASDIDQILQLQNRNLAQNLTEAQRQRGFLLIDYTQAEFLQMMAETGVFVAISAKGELFGYLCSSLPSDNVSSEICRAMFQATRRFHFRGHPLHEWLQVVYGPVCVDEQLRGQGVYQALFAAAKAYLSKDYQVAISLIAASNQRSFRSATQKTEAELVGEFEAVGSTYRLMARQLSETLSR